MPAKAYSSLFFQLPNVPPAPHPYSHFYQQHFRGKSFLSLDNADSDRNVAIGEEEEEEDENDEDGEGGVDSSESVWTAFTQTSSSPSSFVIGRATHVVRSRPVLATLDTRGDRVYHPRNSPASSSHSSPKSRLRPHVLTPALASSTVFPSPPVLPELPETPSLSLPFDFDVDKSNNSNKSAAPPPVPARTPPASTPKSVAPPYPPRLKTTFDDTTPKPLRPSPILKPAYTTPSATTPPPRPPPAPPLFGKTPPKSTPLQSRPATEPQPSRRQRPLSTSTVSTNYRNVRRADALACLEGKRRNASAPEAYTFGAGFGVKSATTAVVISAKPAKKSTSKWADVKSFMPLHDTSSDEDDDDYDDDNDLNVQVVGVKVGGKRHTIESWYVGPSLDDDEDVVPFNKREESRFSTPSQSPVSSTHSSTSGSSMIVSPEYYDDRSSEIDFSFPTSVEAKSSPTLASVKPSGNFIDLGCEGEGDVYEYEYWR